jgi:hypothetical protein
MAPLVCAKEPAMNRITSSSSHAGSPGSRVKVFVTLILLIAPCTAIASEEVVKALSSGGTTTAPAANSWERIRQSFAAFGEPGMLLRLLLGLGLSVLCAIAVAWHPRRSTRLDPLSDLEERKAIILLGVVGAVIAELSVMNQSLAFVIFGIGALLRFRTVLDNPKVTGKAIMVVAIGLACGLGAWAMAVFVTAFTCGLIFWLDSHVSCRLRVRLSKQADFETAQAKVREYLVAHHVIVKSSATYETKRQLVFLTHIPAGLDPSLLVADMQAAIEFGGDADIDVRFV